MLNLVTDSMWTMTSNVLVTLSGVVISVLVARSLGPEGFGTYALILLIVSTMSFALNPGIYAAANYYLSSHKLPHTNVFRLSLSLALPFAVVAGGLLMYGPSELIGLEPLEGTLDNTIRSLTAIATASLIIGNSANGIVVGAGRIKLISKWLTVVAIVHVGLITAFWLGAELDLKVSVVVYCSIQVLTTLLKILLALPAGRVSQATTTEEVKEFIRYGLLVYSSRVVWFISQRIDTYLVLLLAGKTSLGYYSLASSLAGQIRLIPAAVGTSMMPNIGALPHKSAASVVNRASQAMLLLMLMGGTLLGVAGWFLIPLVYGTAFKISVIPFLVMLPGIIAIGSYQITEPYFQAKGAPLIPVLISLAGAAANLIFCLLLVPQYGIIGASLSYSASYGVQLIVTCLMFSRQTGLPKFSLIDVRTGKSVVLELAHSLFRSARPFNTAKVKN